MPPTTAMAVTGGLSPEGFDGVNDAAMPARAPA